MKHFVTLIIAVSFVNLIAIPALSDGEMEPAMTLDVTGLSHAASTLSRIYQRGISVEVGPDATATLLTATIQVRKGSPTNTISELTSKLDDYVFADDSATGIYNIYPRVGSHLNWQISNIAATNLTIAEVFANDRFGFKRHGVIFSPGRGNLSWLGYKINITEADSIGARLFLNKLCSELPFKARWELRSPHVGSDAILTFYGYGNQPTP